MYCVKEDGLQTGRHEAKQKPSNWQDRVMRAPVNALAKAGRDLNEDGSVVPRPKGKASLVLHSC